MMTEVPAMSTLAVMVTRAYADRVLDALIDDREGWFSASATNYTTPTRRKHLLGPPSSRVLHATGTGRKARNVYNLVFIENCTKSLTNLHPMARQNISWGVILTHEFKGDDMEVLGQELYAELMDQGFEFAKHCLRADTFPKELSAFICQSLQHAAGGPSSEDPYEGPITMTMSASKCTHVVSVIRHETGYAWNVDDRETHFAANFNQSANDEILLEPTDSRTGNDLSSTDVAANVPVSRAYYKLRQVWDEILCNEITNISGVGVDLGASPGGWTQALCQHIGLSKVIAIDPGALAHRVMSLPGVVHVAADLSSAQAANTIDALDAPISLLVCDACVLSYEILDKILELIQRLDGKAWSSMPAAFVITLKLPYRSPASIDRNLEKVKKTIPSLLNKAASIMYNDKVTIRYQVLHLMANSDLERTLVAIFEP